MRGIYGCTYVRWAPKQWFYTNEELDVKVVNALQDIDQLKEMYAAYVLEAVTKNNADVM